MGIFKGALAVTMVLLIPNDLSFENWNLSVSPKEFLLAITVGCIFATLFIKATSIKSVMRKLKLDTLTAVEITEANEARALIHRAVTKKIKLYESRGYIDPTIADTLNKDHQLGYESACRDLVSTNTNNLSLRVLRLFAIGIEKKHLKDLYHHEEVNERVFKRLAGKLQLQLESIEQGNLAPDMSLHTDGKDVFERLASRLRQLMRPLNGDEIIADKYMYYRAQTIISRKVLKEIENLSDSKQIFNPEAIANVVKLYTQFKTNSENKMQQTSADHPKICHPLSITLAKCAVHKIEESALHELYERQLLSSKLYISLREEMLVKTK